MCHFFLINDSCSLVWFQNAANNVLIQLWIVWEKEGRRKKGETSAPSKSASVILSGFYYIVQIESKTISLIKFFACVYVCARFAFNWSIHVFMMIRSAANVVVGSHCVKFHRTKMPNRYIVPWNRVHLNELIHRLTKATTIIYIFGWWYGWRGAHAWERF